MLNQIQDPGKTRNLLVVHMLVLTGVVHPTDPPDGGDAEEGLHVSLKSLVIMSSLSVIIVLPSTKTRYLQTPKTFQ